MEFELARVRLHDRTGDDRGLVELPVGWTLERGDLLVDDECRLVRVVELVPVEQPARIAALAKVGREGAQPQVVEHLGRERDVAATTHPL